MKIRIGYLTAVLLAFVLPIAAQVGGNGTQDFVPIWINSNTLGNSTLVETQGMVGIGTTSPTATLHVMGSNGPGNGGNAPVVVQVNGGVGASSNTGTGGTGSAIQLIGGQGGNGSGTIINRGGGGGGISLTAGTGGSGGPPHGGVGPGGSILLTSGAGGGGIANTIYIKGGSGSSIGLNGAGANGGNVQITGGGGGYSCNALHCISTKTFFNGGSITLQGGGGKQFGNILLAPNGGNVGIGEAAAANTFEVKVGGTTLADAWTVRSSRRFKINIRPLEGALEKIERLQGVSYERKIDGKQEIGVVAEDVEQIIPEVVSRDPNTNEVQGVDYSRLSALLIEAVKSQQAEIQQLKTRIEQLTSKKTGR